MSHPRENVIWQSADGTWGRGFYEEYDDSGLFDWVSVGHLTRDEAGAAWDGANPGGVLVYNFGDSDWPGEPPVAEKFDEMAVVCAASGYYAHGVPPEKVQDYRDRAAISRFYFTNRSYDQKTKKLSQVFAQSDDEEVRKISALLNRRPELAEYARECKQKVIEHQKKRIDDARSRGRSSTDLTYAMDAIQRAAAEMELLDRVKIPAIPARMQVQSQSGTGRGKTTAASTAGSFAPKVGSVPEVSLK